MPQQQGRRQGEHSPPPPPPQEEVQKRGGGIWACLHCGRTFDDFNAANYHEAYDCPSNPNVAAIAAPPPSPPQPLPEHHHQQHHPYQHQTSSSYQQQQPLHYQYPPQHHYQHHHQQPQASYPPHPEPTAGSTSSSHLYQFVGPPPILPHPHSRRPSPPPPSSASLLHGSGAAASSAHDPSSSALYHQQQQHLHRQQYPVSGSMEEDDSPRQRPRLSYERIVYRRERDRQGHDAPQPSSRLRETTRQRRHLLWRDQDSSAIAGSNNSSSSPDRRQTTTPAQAQMEQADVVACQSIEVFEVESSAQFDAHESSSSSSAVVDSRGVRIRPTVGQVGLRCIHCIPSPNISSSRGDHQRQTPQGSTVLVVGTNTVFPINVHEIGGAIRQIAESHLVSCAQAPRQVCRSMEQALARRRASQAEAIGHDGNLDSNNRSDNDNEGGERSSPRASPTVVEGGGRRRRASGNSSVAAARFEQEEYRRHLLDYCAERVNELDLADYQPPPGISFRTPATAGAGPPPYTGAPEQSSLSAQSRGTDRPIREAPESFGVNLTPTPSSFGEDRPFRSSPSVVAPVLGGGGAPGPRKSPPPPQQQLQHQQIFQAPSIEDSMASTGTEPIPVQLQQRQQQAPQAQPSQQRGSPPEDAQDNMPANFPFRREPAGDWICKFCQNVQPQFRDPQYRWAASNQSPPPAHFIDHHLNQCRMYQQSLLEGVHQDIPTHVGFPFHAPLPSHRQQQAQRQQQQPYPQHQPLVHTQQPGREIANWDSTMATSVGAQAAVAGSYYSQTGIAMMPSSSRGYRGMSIPEMGREGRAAGVATQSEQAIEHLRATDLSNVDVDGRPLPEAHKLVLDEDRLLLTDYFYYLMKQLRLVRFTESDRKTRGGKREKIQVGYGGLQCVHCAAQSNARKFFWSNVDRLANSFAEIPAHVLKCRSCPERTKQALLTLKEQHPDQMTRLPRGSQKVFFRRMWRRLHDQDPVAGAPPAVPPSPLASTVGPTQPLPLQAPMSPGVRGRLDDAAGANLVAVAAPSTPAGAPAAGRVPTSPGTSKSDESNVIVERNPVEAAKALAESAIHSGPPSPTSRVLLAIPEDAQWLSDHDCLIRKQIEVFCATKEDIETARADRKYPVVEGQVGIRCIHCAIAKGGGANGQAVSYPFSVGAIYESVREFHRLHLYECEHLPLSVKSKLAAIRGSASLSSVLRKYYVLSARCLGLVDTKDGIRAGGEAAPLGSQAAFSFAAESSPTAGMDPSTSPSSPTESRKRPRSDDDDFDGDGEEDQDRKPSAR